MLVARCKTYSIEIIMMQTLWKWWTWWMWWLLAMNYWSILKTSQDVS